MDWSKSECRVNGLSAEDRSLFCPRNITTPIYIIESSLEKGSEHKRYCLYQIEKRWPLVSRTLVY